MTVDENDRAELRYDHLEIYAGGELMRTLEVRQQAPAPAIATNFTEKQVAASAASFDVLVTCNAEWRAEVSPEDEAWLSLGERTATRLNVVCAVNDTGCIARGRGAALHSRNGVRSVARRETVEQLNNENRL